MSVVEPDLHVIDRLLDLRSRVRREEKTAEISQADCAITVLGCDASSLEICEFFSRTAGPVAAVRRPPSLRDVALVAFESRASVALALAMESPEIAGRPVTLQKIELNRKSIVSQGKDARVFVAGLGGVLDHFTENDWRQLMGIFGKVTNFYLPRCPYSGRPLGAFEATYASAEDAQEAVGAMHGKTILGVKLRAGFYVH